ncbi:MAG: twin-arginine translocase subunit TatC [Nocardioidaceae bacterium]
MAILARPRRGEPNAKPPKSDDGRMALADHLREFRNRLFVSLCSVIIGAVVGWILYDELLKLLQQPLDATIRKLEEGGNPDIRPVINSVAGGFSAAGQGGIDCWLGVLVSGLALPAVGFHHAWPASD